MLHHVIHGEGRPLLILHGLTLDHRYMVDCMEPAFDGRAGWKRIYVDLPGHGQSPGRDQIGCQDDVLSALLAFADETIGGAPFAVAGSSRGSYHARGIVHLRPDQVTGAALIAPGGNPSSDPARLPPHQIIEPDPTIRAELKEPDLWAHENMSVVQRRDIVEKRRQIVAPARALFDPDQEARVVASFDFAFAGAEEQAAFDGPSLIVAGRQDGFSGYLDAVDLGLRYTRSTLAVLDTAGHALVWERPEVFTALVRDWLDRLEQVMPR